MPDLEKYLNSDPEFYGPEYARYIVSTSFTGKDKDRIGVIEIIGRYFTTETGELKFMKIKKLLNVCILNKLFI